MFLEGSTSSPWEVMSLYAVYMRTAARRYRTGSNTEIMPTAKKMKTARATRAPDDAEEEGAGTEEVREGEVVEDDEEYEEVVDAEGSLGDVCRRVFDAEFGSTGDEYPYAYGTGYQCPEDGEEGCLLHTHVVVFATQEEEVDQK